MNMNNNGKHLLNVEFMKLCDWISKENIMWPKICQYSGAINLLKENPEKIDWDILSGNPGAIELLRANPKKIHWKILSGNTGAIELLRENLEKIDWDVLSGNTGAIELLKENPEKINWKNLSSNSEAVELLELEKFNALAEGRRSRLCNYGLCENKSAGHLIEQNAIITWWRISQNPAAIHIIEQEIESAMIENRACKVDWHGLAQNPAAIHILEHNIDKLDNYGLMCLSENPAAITLLRNNFDKIQWAYLSKNPAAITLLQEHPDKINWYNLCKNPAAMYILEQEYIKTQNRPVRVYWAELFYNPSIFVCDYKKITECKKELNDAIMCEMYKPSRIAKYLETNDDVDNYLS